MKKLLGIIVAGLILSGCATSEVSRNYGSSDSYILIGIGNVGMDDRSVQITAGEYCKQRGKYAFYYAWDYISDDEGTKAYVWCKKNQLGAYPLK